MSEISKRFEQLITESQKKLAESNQIMPVLSDDGIIVGDVLITSTGNLKNLWKYNELMYANISLNEVTVRLANLLARNKNPEYCRRLYNADQEYGQWFADWQFLKSQHSKVMLSQQYDRADILLAKYKESKYRVEIARNTITILLKKP